jgi:hypothetical protein
LHDSLARTPDLGDVALHHPIVVAAADYGGYRRRLQVLLSSHCGGRPVLKSPFHLGHLDELLAALPDALVVHTHRAPSPALASWCSLVATISRGTAASIALGSLGQHWFDYWTRAAARAVEVRELADRRRFHDVRYADLISDPLREVRRIYAAAELDLMPIAEQRMDRWLERHHRNRRSRPPPTSPASASARRRSRVDSSSTHRCSSTIPCGRRPRRPVACGPVLTRPADLTDGSLTDHLAAGWGLAVDAITYVPIGFGSHHWTVSEGERRWFVTVDDLDAKAHSLGEPRDAAWQRLATALSAARAATDLGLEFVVAPLSAGDRTVLRRVDDRYAVAVYPFVDGESYSYGEFQNIEHRDAVVEMLARLHAVADPASTGAARDTLAVPHRLDLATAIDALGRPWHAGPYGELARQLLDRNVSAVERLLDHYDRIASGLAERPERMVLTHGEPHPGNTMRSGDRWLIVDWDTTLIAPPERDLWMVAGTVADAAVVDTYEAATGRHVLREGLDCYRLWWDLAEIGCYVTVLREPHDDTEDVRRSWAGLQHYLDPTARWPQLV